MKQKRRSDDYAKHSAIESVATLSSDTKHGLTATEVTKRQAQFGYNEIEERDEPLWHRLFRRFWGPIPWMIEIAALLSAVVQKWDDFIIITIMLLVNAGLDFFQEHRALNALKALKAHLTVETIVLRDGEFKTVPSRELVPGDIVRLRIGNIIPADVQLLQGDYLLIDQSALTGESLPISKKQDEVAYASTIVKQGEMLAVVINTAANTNFHSVVALVAKATLEERSHFQKMVIRIGNFLILITLALVLLIMMVSIFRHEPFLEIARFALVLSVAAIPVALPAVLSVTMAVGAINLARRQAIVSRLTAIEELAGVDVFCSDKTGTLTKNEMQVAEPVMLNGTTEEQLFMMAALASRHENNDPIEQPIFQHLQTNFPDSEWRSYQQLSFTPFDPIRKRTEAEIEKGEQRFTAMKGAAQILVGLSQLDDDEMQSINTTIETLAAKGYRTLAIARKQGDNALQLLGLIPMYDPPRDDSSQVISEMQDYGVEVKMITGDNMAIAKEIGRLLGLEQRTMRAEQLSGAATNELLTLATVLSAAIYQRLTPGVSRKEAQHFANDVMSAVKTMYDPRLLEREFIHTTNQPSSK